MHACRNPLHCFIPPHIVDRLAESDDREIRRQAIETIKASSAARATRTMMSIMPMLSAIPSPEGKLHRLVYDMQGQFSMTQLPGALVRSEGDAPHADEAVNEAYDYSGETYRFYKEVFKRNSLDNQGMSLISSVHFRRNYNNAFWNGEQMTYGDGDNRIFQRFTKSLDVVAHELTHGVVEHTCNLVYADESGALNESFADVMSALTKQWRLKQTVDQADWAIGPDVFSPNLREREKVKGIRVLTADKAFENHPDLGTDPQPKHMADIRPEHRSPEDAGGVHILSGIPNHAFYLVATQLGGYAWERAGLIWYKTMKRLVRTDNFQKAANMTYEVALAEYGPNSAEAQAIEQGWGKVGITLGKPARPAVQVVSRQYSIDEHGHANGGGAAGAEKVGIIVNINAP